MSMNKDRITAETLIGTGLDSYVTPLTNLIEQAREQHSLVEQVVEFALMAGYLRGQTRGEYEQWASLEAARRPLFGAVPRGGTPPKDITQ